MQVILSPTKAAASVCRPAGITESPCRFSRFVLSVPCNDGFLLYHVMTGELLLLSPEEYRNGKPEGELQRTMLRRRFLVPEDFDEYAYARQFRRIAELLAPPDRHITAFTVFTTTDCNARCAYCYELGRPRLPMSDQVARDAAAYIAGVSGGENVKLTWFGGEPLYNPSAIRVLTEELDRRGVPFRSNMVTNGLLFNEETVHSARERWRLERVQITLDGTEEVYNRTKNYVGVEGSAYRRVLENVELLLEAGMTVTLRLNAHAGNLEDLYRLTEVLDARFQGERHLGLYSVLLRDFGPSHSQPQAQTDTLSAWDRLQRRIIASSIGKVRRPMRRLQVNSCIADNDGSVTILPDGRLGKCEHESERLLVGSIYDGVTDPDTVARWKQRVEVPECAACPFYPTCIRLRLCAWTGDDCTETDRQRIRLSVSQSVLAEYSNYLASSKRKGDETDEAEADAAFSGFGR